MNGAFLVFAKKTAKKRRKFAKNNPLYKNKAVKHIIQSGIVYVLFTITLVFFRLPDTAVAVDVLIGMFKGWASIINIGYVVSTLKLIGIGKVSGLLLAVNMIILLCVELKEEKNKEHVSYIIRKQPVFKRITIYYGLLLLIIFFGNMAQSSYIYYAY